MSGEKSKYENDFKFIAGKYKDLWLSDIDDKGYIIFILENWKLNNKNKLIFEKRLSEINSREQ